MNYIVLDMEWNQPFSKQKRIAKPMCLHGEIVQIGAVKLNENLRQLDTFKIGIKPKYYTKMHTKVQQLTGISDVDLHLGHPFLQAFEIFRRWCGEDFVFLAWGLDDIRMLRDNMLLHGLDPGWIPKAYNLQTLFDAQITKENRQCSLSYAVETLHETEREAHDALNDALMTCSVCRHLDIKKGLQKNMEIPRERKVKIRSAAKSAKKAATHRQHEVYRQRQKRNRKRSVAKG